MDVHVGAHNSSHNKRLKACEYLMKQKEYINIMVAGILSHTKLDYRVCLNASIEYVRYVNKHGCIIKRILGIVHVLETISRIVKDVVDSFFSTYGLSTSRIRGQGYNGASNISGNVGNLKSLILGKNQIAFYVHCFAQQLQLTLVSIARKHEKLSSFFDYLAALTYFVGASCKRKELLWMKQIEK
ncbi:hypothetical protein SCA6_019372, partial [Theobroma cacao]